MRGSGMEDVIFSGTSDRPARNNAEVTIYLDNEERNAPSEFNDQTEIQVKRKIEVEKGSDYKINGKDVRARDVTKIICRFIYRSSFSIINQPRARRLINKC